MAKIPESEIERLKSEVSLVRLAEVAGVKLTKRGKDYVGCCPFHDDRTPSFIISPDKNLWNCLGACGQGGDVISFVMKVEGVSFRHGVELLRDGYAPTATGAPVKKATVQKLEAFARDESDSGHADPRDELLSQHLKRSAGGSGLPGKARSCSPGTCRHVQAGIIKSHPWLPPAKPKTARQGRRSEVSCKSWAFTARAAMSIWQAHLVVPILDY